MVTRHVATVKAFGVADDFLCTKLLSIRQAVRDAEGCAAP